MVSMSGGWVSASMPLSQRLRRRGSNMRISRGRTSDVKTIREGGNNGRQIRLTGPLTFGQVTMKRGMTSNLELWDWFNLMLSDQSLRADAEVVIFASDGETERARFQLSRCVPVKLKSPPLNAKDGAVAIEELQIAYEKLTLKKP